LTFALLVSYLFVELVCLANLSLAAIQRPSPSPVGTRTIARLGGLIGKKYRRPAISPANPFGLLSFGMTLLGMMLKHGAGGNFFGSFAVFAGLFSAFFDVLIHALLLGANAVQVLSSRHSENASFQPAVKQVLCHRWVSGASLKN
jgi:hypothetical protein